MGLTVKQISHFTRQNSRSIMIYAINFSLLLGRQHENSKRLCDSRVLVAGAILTQTLIKVLSYKRVGFFKHYQESWCNDAGTEDAEGEDEIGVAEHSGVAAAAVVRGLRQIRAEVKHWF